MSMMSLSTLRDCRRRPGMMGYGSGDGDGDENVDMCVIRGAWLVTLGSRQLHVRNLALDDSEQRPMVRHRVSGSCVCPWRDDAVVIGHDHGLFIVDAMRNVVEAKTRAASFGASSIASDGELVVCGSRDGEILVWHPGNGCSIRLRTGDLRVWGVAIFGRRKRAGEVADAEDTTLFASCGDGTRAVRLWEVSFDPPHRFVVCLRGSLTPSFGRSHGVLGLRRIGARGVAAFTSREIRVWDVDARRLTWRMATKRCRDFWSDRAVSIADVRGVGAVLHAFVLRHRRACTAWLTKQVVVESADPEPSSPCAGARSLAGTTSA